IPAREKPPFPNKTQMDIPFFKGLDPDSAGSFGAGVLVNTTEAGATNGDGYLYIYGVRGKQKEIIVARVKPAALDQFDQWRFWNGKSWTNDINTISPIADHASNEMSVSQLEDGRYIMVFQEDGLSSRIGIKLGASPAGPFGEMIAIYDAKDDLRDSPNLFSYNAKAHPVLSNRGELLISYNINSFDFNTDIKKNPHLYRPRFIKLKYE
ncbi:MAG TPA: DUF4185 domain-containing protein, partial [Agriterribacter sp.]|nr:DUF4185 domain-containing protein [Agriterribacter sp.]